MAGMQANRARTSSHGISISTTPIASWLAPSVGITCGSGLPSNSARCVSFAFLDEPAAVPSGVADHLAQQLGIPDAGCLTQYATARGRWLHSAEIKERHGYREFTDAAARFRLARWLYALCWTGTDRPSVLFDRATVWLVTEKVLLPGASALERLIARIRARAGRRLWRGLAREVTREQRAQLEALLVAGEGGRPSPLDRLRDGPFMRSGAELTRAVARLDEVRL